MAMVMAMDASSRLESAVLRVTNCVGGKRQMGLEAATIGMMRGKKGGRKIAMEVRSNTRQWYQPGSPRYR
jgi:hypothetical protein